MKTVSGTILVADDDADIREILSDTLASLGAKVVVAADGQGCLNQAEANAADLILLDIEMPVMNGLDVLKQLKRHGNDTSLIMITAYGTIERAAVLGQDPEITVHDLPLSTAGGMANNGRDGLSYRQALETAKREVVVRALLQIDGTRAAAARLMGLHKTHLLNLIKSLRIE